MKSSLILLLALLTTSFQVGSTEILLTENNIVNISGPISTASINVAIEDLVNQDNKRKSNSTIYIVVNSGGGEIVAGNKFITFANTVPNVKVICMYCASMAHAILQGIKGERLVTEDNLLMAHRAKGSFGGQFGAGEVESRLKVFTQLVEHMEQRNADRIGVSLKYYKQKVINEWWTFGKESIKLNIADKIVSMRCSKKLISLKRPTVIRTLFGPMPGPEASQCPLI